MKDTSSGLQGNVSKYLAHELLTKWHVSWSLRAILQLGIPDILHKQGSGKPMTAAEILAHLPAKTPDNVNNLSRPLKMLVLEGFFTESFNGKKQSMYGLTEVSKWFVTDTKDNMIAISDLHFDTSSLDVSQIFTHLPKSILDENVVPFVEVYGCPGYDHAMKNPTFSAKFQAMMVTYSNMEIATTMESLQKYDVLKGVETLVDVGGGTGSNIADIIAKFPHIKGINYDLPNVAALAPEVKGMTSLGGDMFESVPSGDAMLIKWVLHNYDDKAALKVLTNCFEALPKQGKVIIVEYILADGTDASPRAKMAATMDLMMQVFNKGAMERTKAHYQELIAAAGFQHCQFIRDAEAMDLIVAHKG